MPTRGAEKDQGMDLPATCLILVHTGTGNSLQVARWLAGELTGGMRQVGLVQMVAGIPIPAPPQGRDDLLALVFPTHGFTLPWAVLARLLALPRRSGVPALVLATRAGSRWGSWCAPGVEGSAGLLAAAVLAWKGYRLLGWRGIDMPSNWTALHPAYGLRSVVAIRAKARLQVAAVVERVRRGVPLLDASTLLQTAIGILLAPVSLGYLLVGRQVLARLFIASEACDGCGICRDRCPQRAIRWFIRRPYWTSACESCMRCMSVCPRRAVQVTQVLAVVHLLCGLLAAGAVATALVSAWPVLTGWFDQVLPDLLLSAIVLVPVLVLTYAAVWLLGRTPLLGLLVHGLTLTRWYRRHLDPEVEVGELVAAPPGPAARS